MKENHVRREILLGLRNWFEKNQYSCLDDLQIAQVFNCDVREARYHIQKLEQAGYITTIDASNLQGECLAVSGLTSDGWMVSNGKVEMIDPTNQQPSHIKLTQNFNGSVGVQQNNLGTISGNLNNTISQLCDLNNPGTKELAELLAEIKELIESEPYLSKDDKTDSLEQVQILAEASQNQDNGVLRKAAKTAMQALRGIASTLPPATKFVEDLNRLIPEISKLLGF